MKMVLCTRDASVGNVSSELAGDIIDGVMGDNGATTALPFKK